MVGDKAKVQSVGGRGDKDDSKYATIRKAFGSMQSKKKRVR